MTRCVSIQYRLYVVTILAKCEVERTLTMHPQAMKMRLGTVHPRLGTAAPHHVDAGLHGE